MFEIICVTLSILFIDLLDYSFCNIILDHPDKNDTGQPIHNLFQYRRAHYYCHNLPNKGKRVVRN